MEIIELNKRGNSYQKLSNIMVDFETLIAELTKRDLPDEITSAINKNIQAFNSFSGSDKMVLKHLKKVRRKILVLLEKELKLVTKNHYRNFWLVVGMIVFGIPIGTAIGTSIGNMAFTGIGMVIGMIVGITVGTAKDKEAFEKGNQINLEFKN